MAAPKGNDRCGAVLTVPSRRRPPPRPQGGTLLPHQREGLRFMLAREATDFRADMWAPLRSVSGLDLWYSPAMGRLSETAPPGGVRGGFLADHMGLGKTVMTLALVAATLKEQEAPTLVVCPAGLVTQWRDEAARWVPSATLRVLETTARRGTLAAQLAGAPDIAFASYATLARLDTAGVQLHRVVFDEAHTLPSLRPPSAQRPAREHSASEACASVDAALRWALSGTPVGSTDHAMHSAMAALRIQPFRDWGWNRAMVSGAFGCAALACAQLAACTLRRDSTLLADAVPARRDHPVQLVEMMPVDRAVYDASLALMECQSTSGAAKAKRRLAAGGTYEDAVLAEGGLWYTYQGPDQGPGALAMPRLDPTVADEERCAEGCSICLAEPVRAPQAATPCGHCFCGECVMAWAATRAVPRCPLCRAEFALRALRLAAPLPVPPRPLGAAPDPRVVEERKGLLRGACSALPADPLRPGNVVLRSRPAAVAAKVKELLEDEGAAVVVFSHFQQAMELTADLVGRKDAAVMAGDPAERQEAAARFQRGEARVLVLPYASRLTSGLNLTAANHVVLAEPAHEAGEEEQGIGRAWRLGQQREVHVWRFAPQFA